ncbi:MAG: alcohol dehydrogenase catalytic domain-containing protein [Alphaproteobacteria bacterium]
MKAAVLTGIRQPLEIQVVPDPVCHSNGAILKVEANGVCRSDFHCWDGTWNMPLPWVLGHEFCGIVKEVGKAVRHVKKGDRVIAPFIGGRGTCNFCRSGLPHMCSDPVKPGFGYWGGMAQYVEIQAADFNLIKMPEELEFTTAAALGCRYMTSWGAITERTKVQPGELVVVAGAGGIGLSAIQIAVAHGAEVVAIDIRDDALELAIKVGAAHTINALQLSGSLAEAVKDTAGRSANVSVDALGMPQTCGPVIETLGVRGRHAQIGMTTSESAGHLQVPIDHVIAKEISICGVKGMPTQNFLGLLAMVTQGKVKPEILVTKELALDRVTQEFEAMSRFSTLGFSVIRQFDV